VISYRKPVVLRARAGARCEFHKNGTDGVRNPARTRRSEWPPIGAFRGEAVILNGLKNLPIYSRTHVRPAAGCLRVLDLAQWSCATPFPEGDRPRVRHTHGGHRTEQKARRNAAVHNLITPLFHSYQKARRSGPFDHHRCTASRTPVVWIHAPAGVRDANQNRVRVVIRRRSLRLLHRRFRKYRCLPRLRKPESVTGTA